MSIQSELNKNFITAKQMRSKSIRALRRGSLETVHFLWNRYHYYFSLADYWAGEKIKEQNKYDRNSPWKGYCHPVDNRIAEDSEKWYYESR